MTKKKGNIERERRSDVSRVCGSGRQSILSASLDEEVNSHENVPEHWESC